MKLSLFIVNKSSFLIMGTSDSSRRYAFKASEAAFCWIIKVKVKRTNVSMILIFNNLETVEFLKTVLPILILNQIKNFENPVFLFTLE